MGFAPEETLLRSRRRMVMKSDALSTPITLLSLLSQMGADAMPWTTFAPNM